MGRCFSMLFESIPHLSPDGRVEGLFKMLTYSRVCCTLLSASVFPSNTIRGFEMASRVFTIFAGVDSDGYGAPTPAGTDVANAKSVSNGSGKDDRSK